MLSIGKLAAGQAKYYLDQAEVRVDVVDSVAEGARITISPGSLCDGLCAGFSCHSPPTCRRRSWSWRA